MPDIVAFAAHVAAVLELPAGLANQLELRVTSTAVNRKKDRSLPDPDPLFLSSPYAQDIERVADEAPRGFGRALASYLSDPEPKSGRLDVRTEYGRRRVLEGLQPAAFAPARWPAATNRKLVTGQQFAVNEIVAELAGEDGGLFAVNGPPGTGKTTLLRDLIAAVVVRRAQVLATLASPKDGFGETLTWRGSDGKERGVRRLRADLTGFEIVVASSNNTAVENITKELPTLTAISEERRGASYFADQATALLGQPAWGLLAAALGKAEKRAEFRNRFWFSDSGMRTELRTLRDAARPGDWRTAVNRFTAAMDEARKLAAERSETAAAWQSPLPEAELASARRSAADAESALARAEAGHRAAQARVARWQQDAIAVQAELDAQVAARPGGLLGLVGIGRAMRDWHQRAGELTERIGAVHRDQQAAREAAAGAQRAVAAARGAAATEADRLRRLEARQRAESERIKHAREEWGVFFPEGWPGLAQDEQELAAPWSDDAWVEARADVFLAALDLQRAFIAGAAATFLRNLGHLVDTLGRVPDGPPPPQELAAWQTLFLVIPVISTTFASCGRMFARFGRESLGWLLVDEAGQALPQAAVGALWRSRRAVIVGDPRQLEPISQVPVEVQEKLRELSGLAPHWLPAGTSAQGLADRRSVLGTEVATDDEPVWVGTPLRVHRRCEHPMFEMSNDLAYGGLMVYGTAPKRFPGATGDECPPSYWVDVPGAGDGGGKWVAEQGRAAAAVLRNLRSRRFGVKLGDIYVLSPFRDVVHGCQHDLESVLTREARTAEAETGIRSRELAAEHKDFLENHIGTVHKMQGREADVVILVLGADRSPARKARAWVGHPPNLLNVAVSRARRRLFVVGDYEEWAAAPNFAVFADREAFKRLPYRQ